MTALSCLKKYNLPVPSEILPCGFIQQEDFRVFQYGPCQCYTLFLTTCKTKYNWLRQSKFKDNLVQEENV